MTMATPAIQWQAVADKAATMTDADLNHAILSICESLESADAMDIETGTTRGGLYRDEISIYREELRLRAIRTSAVSVVDNDGDLFGPFPSRDAARIFARQNGIDARKVRTVTPGF